MRNGKKICEHLKLVRKQIADANGIPYQITECSHQGPCAGTCPKCESELRYIENQLSLRRAAGKAVSIVGLSMGISTAFMATGCTPTTKTSEEVETSTQDEEQYYDSEGEIIITKQNLSEFMSQSKDTVTEQPVSIIEQPASVTEQPVTVIEGAIEYDSEEKIDQKERTNSEDSVVQIDETKVYDVAEKQPEFPGGDDALNNFIKENLHYPTFAAEIAIQGRVTLAFIVETDGTISNIEVMRSPIEEFSQEAIRVVKMMPKWEPGKMRDTPVRVKYILPVSFRFD